MKEILQALQRSDLVVTPTKRLARELVASFNREQMRAGVGAWPTPRVLPWHAWTASLVEQGDWGTDGSPALVLDPDQARVVWEQVLRESGLLADHVPAASMVDEVMRAYRTAQEYSVAIPAPEAAANENLAAFASWSRAYQAKLAQRGWMDPGELPVLLERWVQSGVLAPQPVHLVETGEFCPAQHRLLDAMAASGWALNIIDPESASGCARACELAGPEEELEQAAAWAYARLREDPAQRLAVVVADLADSRQRVEQVFSRVLAPGTVLPGQEEAALPFHISLGRPLAGQAMVSQALSLLEWLEGETGLETVSRVLRGQYLATDPEANWRRAELEAELRRQGWKNVELPAALRKAREMGINALLVMEPLAELPADDTGRALPSAWAERFTGWLNLAGWPGIRGLDSEEYQVLEAWRDVLAGFSRLDPVTGAVEFRGGLARLKKLARDKVFQAEAGEVPLQVLDPREAQGLSFDAVWVTGWHDEAWPQPGHPSPFLPLAAQQTAGVPGSSPDIQYAHARATFERLQRLGAECVFSWPAAQDERPLRPSALLRGLPEAEPVPPSPTSHALNLHASGRLQARPQPVLPKIPAGNSFRGGVSVLEHQSACPFRAFAEHRLRAGPLETPGPGLEARERGTRVHRAMSAIWNQLKDQDTLLAMDQQALETLIAVEVDRAFRDTPVNAPGASRGRLLEMERRRVAGLVQGLMALEKNRPSFRVLECESDTLGELGGLVLKIRPDRVDVLPGGSQVILDYKTGKAAPSDWLKDRMRSVQMPVYLVCREPPGQGLMFVTLAAGNVLFSGALAEDEMMQTEPDQVKRLKWSGRAGVESWEELLAAWRDQFIRLARDFRHGDYRVDPAENGKACNYCHLPTLCRVAERGRTMPDE